MSDRTCASCLFSAFSPKTPRRGVCFVADEPTPIRSTDEACKGYCSRMTQYSFGVVCNRCSRSVDLGDRFCRHCGMEFVPRKGKK